MLPSLLPRNWLFKLKDNLTLPFLPPIFTTQLSVKAGWLVCNSNGCKAVLTAQGADTLANAGCSLLTLFPYR